MESRDHEHELLRRLSRGDRIAFRLLHERLAPAAYAVALRVTRSYEEAEEATQDAFVDFAKLGSKLEALNDAGAWLTRVVSRRAIDLLRRRRAHDAPVGDVSDVVEVDALASASPSPLGGIVAADMAARVRELTARLPERQLLAFTLRHFHGMSIKEVAAAMECTDGAVKAHLFQAMQKIRGWLRDEGAMGERKQARKAGR